MHSVSPLTYVATPVNSTEGQTGLTNVLEKNGLCMVWVYFELFADIPAIYRCSFESAPLVHISFYL
jgi:hypothetical protein